MRVPKILVVDDELGVLNALKRLLRKESFAITATDSPQEALSCLTSDAYAVLLSDQRMPAMEGLRLLEKAREISPDTVRIMLTGYLDTRTAIEAINRGRVSRFITKPWNDQELRMSLQQAVSQYELVMENRRLQVLTEWQNATLKEINQDLAKARQQEVEFGAKIQQMLLLGPPCQNLRGAQAAARSVPSEQADGDFYDFFRHTDQCLDLVVGDVMGKGVAAALLGAATKSQLLHAMNRAMSAPAREGLPQPEAIVGLLHGEVTEQLIALENFVTLCYARFDLEKGRLDYVNCGHPRALHFQQRTGRCAVLQGENMPLGFSRTETYQQHSVPIEPGDLVFFYSDGITEVQDEKGEFFGETRLLKFVQARGRLDPEMLVEEIHRALIAFSNSEKFTDDLTCAAVQLEAVKAADDRLGGADCPG